MTTKPGRTTTAIRFPNELHDHLKQAADERGLSINYVVVKAVEEFLDRLIPVEEFRLTRTG
jgi:predicted DNA-binding protein